MCFGTDFKIKYVQFAILLEYFLFWVTLQVFDTISKLK